MSVGVVGVAVVSGLLWSAEPAVRRVRVRAGLRHRAARIAGAAGGDSRWTVQAARRWA
ncbi:hypothetical protein G3I34_18515, partial [Streptomyces sp. SID8014]|nr:hypothetical protein [Streptomyces sp. SID8014]